MSKTAQIPFLDLVTPHLELEDEFVSVFRDALSTGRFIGGPMVEEFENEFAGFCGAKHCVGVGSGTDALRFALIAAGIKQGDTVITVSNTFIATTEAVTQAGGTPVFVDINERTYNMDPEKLRDFLETKCVKEANSGRTTLKKNGSPVTAVIPVHLYGQMADMDAIIEIADRYKLIVIEDACQAHGARYFSKKENRWVNAGSMGAAAAFSFYPGKNLGAFGEGGAVTTNNKKIASQIRMLRDHGQVKKYYHEAEGYNGRLDAIQAGVLKVKLKYLDEGNESRRKNASLYNELLGAKESVITPHEPEWSKAVYHLYVIRVKDRDGLHQYLSERNLSAGLHYPIPLHLQNAYRHMGYREGDLPATEKVSKEILSLPMYPHLSPEQIKAVTETVLNFI